MVVALLCIAWLATLAYALVLACSLREHVEQVRRLADQAQGQVDELVHEFQVGDRVDVAPDDVATLSETRLQRILERAKEDNRWAS